MKVGAKKANDGLRLTPKCHLNCFSENFRVWEVWNIERAIRGKKEDSTHYNKKRVDGFEI